VSFSRKARFGVVAVLAVALVAAIVVVGRSTAGFARTHVVAYFANSNGLFVGDEVRVLGVPVGEITEIEAQPQQVKVSFWIDNQYKVPAEADAAILAPSLVTARAIQLTPAYTSGPAMADGAVISQDRTVVPMEWDDLRVQLEKLTDALQPTEPGGVSTLGAFIDTSAENLRGEGQNIRAMIINLGQALSALGDHSSDIFSTVRNLSVLVNALHSSTDLLAGLNRNLAATTALLANDPNEVGIAVSDLATAVTDVQGFLSENHEAIGTTTDKLASVTTTVMESMDDIKQTLHVAPNAFQNFLNIFQPAQAAKSGALVVNNFANPISFLCGAIQAASRLGAEQSAKLCAQYLAPIVKNRQYNFPPIGENLVVGTQARPNEVTWSEDWMRPDFVPPLPAAAPPVTETPTAAPVQAPADAPLAAEASESTNPAAGLPGLMMPQDGTP
jgi:phospholipid/cholesterol/gamma-HCH transport system substrate-binding protein